MTRAEWRLVPALGVSALLHVLRMPVERARMFVGLITPVDWLFTENDEQPLVN